MTTMIIYGTTTCPYCVKAKELLTTKSIPFMDVDISKSESIKKSLKAQGFTTIPVIYNERGELVGGYTELVGYLGGVL